MAVSYGSGAGGSGNEEKMGLEFYVEYFTGANATGTNQGATPTKDSVSAKVWAKFHVWTKYSFQDTQTCTASITGSGWTMSSYASGWSTKTGVVSTSVNSSYSTSNKQWLFTYYKIFTLTTSAVNLSCTGTMSGLYCSSSARPTKTLTKAVSAIIPPGYPALGDGDYNFGDLTKLISFTLTGAPNFTLYSVTAKLLDGTNSGALVDFGEKTAINDGARWNIAFTDAERTSIFNAWYAVGVRETTALQIIVITTVDGVNSTASSLIIPITSMAQGYGINSVFATRMAFNAGGTQSTSHTETIQIQADTTTPWQQMGVWPTRLLSVPVVGYNSSVLVDLVAGYTALYNTTAMVDLVAGYSAGATTIHLDGVSTVAFAAGDAIIINGVPYAIASVGTRSVADQDVTLATGLAGAVTNDTPVTHVEMIHVDGVTTAFKAGDSVMIAGVTYPIIAVGALATADQDIILSTGLYASVTDNVAVTQVATFISQVGAVASYTYIDRVALDIASTRTYTARLMTNGTQIDVDYAYTIPASEPVLSLYKDPTSGEKRVGINKANPLATLHVGGNLLVDGFSHFRAVKTNAQSCSNSVETIILFDSEEYDLLSEYDPLTGKFTAKTVGYYIITAGVLSASTTFSSPTTRWQIDIMKNASIVACGNRFVPGQNTSSTFGSSICTVALKLAVNDVIYICVNHNHSAAVNTYTSIVYNWFSVDRIA